MFDEEREAERIARENAKLDLAQYPIALHSCAGVIFDRMKDSLPGFSELGWKQLPPERQLLWLGAVHAGTLRMVERIAVGTFLKLLKLY